ncbi:ABC transporter ATP-binding protein [Vagococcus zengguangii]|uniref:ABC transporter ATP-binding protein n=1 Tax=Vagococcus zengguangii TaxID=2571750 RepID=A0A4D7CUC1_9ENTE|nr:ABC transporter ATP-binding protein [Vagococcus zengguangii]QCI86913.1 ABC transporter ATP-binding protein [Vagococcus zengguangii]TLG80511.1 ABC transporter ATP-binding protein [Vagococcus zengguangii]
MTLLDVQHVKKIYATKATSLEVQALKDISFSIESGEFVTIMGESGSGKTSLLNILATLDKPTTGDVLLEGQSLMTIEEEESAVFRRQHLGFVFQDFNLLDNFNVKDNILLPLVLNNRSLAELESALNQVSDRMAIEEWLDKYPYELSGGQQQRVAIARALINQPKLLLADEPTGALDSNTSREILTLFEDLNQQRQTILMVTHSPLAASHSNRVIFIKDGKLFHQLYRGTLSTDDFLIKINQTLSLLQTNGGK